LVGVERALRRLAFSALGSLLNALALLNAH